MDSVDELDIDCCLQGSHEPDPLPAYVETLTKLEVNIVVGIGLNSERDPGVGDSGTDSLETPVVISKLASPSGEGDSSKSGDAFASAVASTYENGTDISCPVPEIHRTNQRAIYPLSLDGRGLGCG